MVTWCSQTEFGNKQSKVAAEGSLINKPFAIAILLINAGYDAKTVTKQQMKGIRDSFRIGECKIENRVLVTLDKETY
jgi:hypothetical protein